MTQKRQYKVLFATDTPGHTAGYYVVAQGLRDAGFEVITTGQQMPEQAVSAAIEEDADILAFRIMDRDPVEIGGAVLNQLKASGAESTPVLIGGIIVKKDVAKLRDMGIAGVFPPGSRLPDIVKRAFECVGESHEGSDANVAVSRP
jgi:methylmalonyl-CoA mutase, C-terminal domain